MPRCQHNRYDMETNFAIVLAVVVAVLMLRELLGWLFKTNHLIALMKNVAPAS